MISTAGGRDHVYLSDFGLSRHIKGSQALTERGVFVETIDYVSPEQARGGRVDARSDVYSLGCVLFEALTGTVPFPLDNDLAKLYAHDSKPPPSVLERAPDLPAAFEPVLMRAMAKSADDRYPSAGDLGRAASVAASGESLAGAERSVAVGEAAPKTPAVPTQPSSPGATAAAPSVRGAIPAGGAFSEGDREAVAETVAAQGAGGLLSTRPQTTVPGSVGEQQMHRPPAAQPKARRVTRLALGAAAAIIAAIGAAIAISVDGSSRNASGRLTSVIPVGKSPQAIAVGEGGVWVELQRRHRHAHRSALREGDWLADPRRTPPRCDRAGAAGRRVGR